MNNDTNTRMLIMDYKDGLELADMPEFIESINKFVEMVKKEYKGEKVRLFFLPEDLASMLINAQNDGDKS